MAINIPSGIYNKYNEWVDLVKRDIVLHFPAKKTECPNCYFAQIGNRPRSVSIYKDGGPQPFPNGSPCSYCSGQGFIEDVATETVQARIYRDYEKWAKQYGVVIEKGSIMTIFNIDDLNSVRNADYCVPKMNDIDTHFTEKYVRSGDIYTDSFKLNPTKYATCFWEKHG